MAPLPPPLAFFLVMFSGWVNQHQQAIIEYLLEENRVLRAARGMSRRLLKLGGGSVTQFLTSSVLQQRVSETATA
jgi:hypothetical protein